MAMMYDVYKPMEESAWKALKAVADVEPTLRRERSMTIMIGNQSALVGTWCFASICGSVSLGQQQPEN
jgi:hypothetical protein